MNSEKIFNYLVSELKSYLEKNNLKSMVLGISGGIDSTVCAAICHEVSKQSSDILLIGRSLPTIYNKNSETTTADLVGKSFCDNFDTIGIQYQYESILKFISEEEPVRNRKPVSNGNLQARLRMMILYDIAGHNSGIVIDTDNKTENNLGYFTLHGDQGDYAPMKGLWKTEVYELAQWILENKCETDQQKEALEKSIGLIPTAGLGITNSDLEEIGAKSYFEVDCILKTYLENGNIDELKTRFGEEVVNNVLSRHLRSEFKRRELPIYPKIEEGD